MERLRGKVAVITGGSGAIGRKFAHEFLEEGAKVVLADVDEGALEDTKKELHAPRRVETVVADVRKEADVEAIFEKAEDAFGRLDIVCANAGIEGTVKPISETSVEEFQRVQDVNVRGVFLTLRSGATRLAKSGGGSVIITSSVAGLQGSPGMAPYCTSKHAVIGLMRTAAQEFGPQGVRVNTINPGPVDNRMMRSIERQSDPEHAEQVKEGFEQQIPMQRYATEADVAHMAVFLASDESTFCNGFTYAVDGGLTSG